MKRKIKYPTWVCDTCGTKHGKWYQPGAIAPKMHCATYHIGKCDICGVKNVPVTEPRDYGHLVKIE